MASMAPILQQVTPLPQQHGFVAENPLEALAAMLQGRAPPMQAPMAQGPQGLLALTQMAAQQAHGSQMAPPPAQPLARRGRPRLPKRDSQGRPAQGQRRQEPPTPPSRTPWARSSS
eukprot:1589708-Alexandrium_andersonii.AAC.1